VQALSSSLHGQHTCIIAQATLGVRCWGDGEYGQLGNSHTYSLPFPSEQDVIVNALSVGAGAFHTCALIDENGGSVHCWGDNSVYQLGDGSQLSRAAPASYPVIIGVSKLSVGGYHSCVMLSVSGNVVCWGANDKGQLGLGDTVSYSTPASEASVTISGVLDIACGYEFTCAVLSYGVIACWGSNDAGQIGANVVDEIVIWPTPFYDLSDVVSVFAGSKHACAIDNSNALYCWGLNNHGQLGIGSTVNSPIPALVVASGVSNAALGNDVTCITDDTTHELFCWGSGSDGQLGRGSFDDVTSQGPDAISFTSATIYQSSSHVKPIVWFPFSDSSGFDNVGVGAGGSVNSFGDPTIQSSLHPTSSLTSAAYFDTGYLQVSTGLYDSSPFNGFSVAFWFHASSSSDPVTVVELATAFVVAINPASGAVSMWQNGQLLDIDVTLPGSDPQNTWYHIVITVDDQLRASVFVNGLFISGGLLSRFTTGLNYLVIGDSPAGFSGYVADFMLFDRGINNTEVGIVYAGSVTSWSNDLVRNKIVRTPDFDGDWISECSANGTLSRSAGALGTWCVGCVCIICCGRCQFDPGQLQQ